MSHSAVSIAPMADAPTRSAGKKPPRKSTCQRCSMRVGSCPISSGLACSTNPITASSREVRLDSPTPQRPASVSTVTNSQLRLSLNTGYVSTLVIFMTSPHATGWHYTMCKHHNVGPKPPDLEAPLGIQCPQPVQRRRRQHVDNGEVEEGALRQGFVGIGNGFPVGEASLVVAAGPSYNGATTMASRVLSTMAFTSSCSGWGAENLSSV